MLENNDIFDEEELLAIANDGDGASSSSCHSSASGDGSDEEDNESLPSQTSHPENTPTPTDATIPKGQNEGVNENDGSSSSDDDSDDGLFGSFFETERKAGAEQNLIQHDDKDNESQSNEPNGTDDKALNAAQHGDENAVAQKDLESTYVANDKDTNSDHHRKKGVNIELGASVLHWNSGRNRSISNDQYVNGVVAVEQSDGRQDFRFSSSSTLRLSTTTPANNPRKRPRTGNEFAKVTIEEVTAVGVSSGRTAMCGRAAHASDAKRLSNPGAMVDCLARYDPQKGCYVLEIVDMSVDNLERLPPKASVQLEQELLGDRGKTTAAANAKTAAVDSLLLLSQSAKTVDPRSIAKRAEAQVRKLKQGKGRARIAASRKKTKRHGYDPLADNKK